MMRNMNVFRGKRVLVTGATDGIGYRAAKNLSSSGAHVVVHGRNPAKVEAVASQVPGAESVVADFASLDSLRSLADELSDGPQIDLLVNNAGVGPGPPSGRRQTSEDGYELRWQVNFLAPFALTEWLLADGGTPAVVNVASIGQAPIDFRDLELSSEYDGLLAYGRSKLALIAWTLDLAARNPEIPANAVHPGTFLGTKMVRELGVTPEASVESGAEAVETVAGLTMVGGASGNFFDRDRPARALDQAYDPTVQARLRRVAEEQLIMAA